jgi:putative FmdB family regulatory protein
MPLYTYSCSGCGYRCEQMRSHTRRNRKQPCPECAAGVLKREIDIPGGLLSNSKAVSQAPVTRNAQAPVSDRSIPNVIGSLEIHNCNTGIKAGDNTYARFDQLNITETPRAFVVGKNVKLEIKNASHDVGSQRKPQKRRKPPV